MANHPNVADPFFDWRERLVREYEHWAIIQNIFPYDLIAEVAHLLIPKRIFAHYEEMTDTEEKELFRIKQEVTPQYDSILENFAHNRSVPSHFHFHLLKIKPEFK